MRARGERQIRGNRETGNRKRKQEESESGREWGTESNSKIEDSSERGGEGKGEGGVEKRGLEF